MVLQELDEERGKDGVTGIMHGQCGYQTSFMGTSAGTISKPDASRERRKGI